MSSIIVINLLCAVALAGCIVLMFLNSKKLAMMLEISVREIAFMKSELESTQRELEAVKAGLAAKLQAAESEPGQSVRELTVVYNRTLLPPREDIEAGVVFVEVCLSGDRFFKQYARIRFIQPGDRIFWDEMRLIWDEAMKADGVIMTEEAALERDYDFSGHETFIVDLRLPPAGDLGMVGWEGNDPDAA